MADNDLLRAPLYPVLRMGNTVIWDLTDFDNADRHELLSSDAITEPTILDGDHVTFCKCVFNIKSLIYKNATAEDILSAWILVKDELKLNRLVKLFLRDSMQNLYLTKNLHEEPDLILILRLVFWYYRCKKLTVSFIHKKKEARDGMVRRLLRRREEISSQLDTDLTDNGIKTLVSNLESFLVKNGALQMEADMYRKQWFTNTWNVTSELLFAGVCGEKGFDVTFVPKSKTHDHDFVVNDFPVQVKSFNTPVLVGSMATSKLRRKSYVETDRVTYDLAINMVKEAIRDKSGELNSALKQGTKLVFVNGTSDESGAFFSQHYFGSGRSFSFEKSVRASMNLVKSDEITLPLIYCSTGIRLIYYLFTLPFKVPLSIVDGQRKVDRSKDIGVLECS